MSKYDYTPAEVKTFLKRRGSKVAVQVAFDGAWFFAEKTDFIANFLKGSAWVDYDGDEIDIAVFTTENCPNIMHVISGTYCREVVA